MEFSFVQKSEQQQNVFGWAYIAKNVEGKTIVDKQGDFIEPEELEKLAYKFVLKYRTSDEMHNETAVGEMIESAMFSKEKLEKLGIADRVPEGWWVGFHISDPEVWASVNKGEYSMFSIGGTASSTTVDIPETEIAA